MTGNHQVEERLHALEEAVAELRQHAGLLGERRDWVQQVAGSVKDVDAFSEALDFGRRIRETDRPVPKRRK